MKPSKIFPAPKGLLGVAPPQANGSMWLLARDGNAATLQVLDLANGSLRGAVPVSDTTDALTELSTGTLVDATATASTGSLELRNGTSGAVSTVIPMSDPVHALAPGANGSTVYALEATPAAEAVAVVDTSSAKVTSTVPVSTGTVAVAASVDGSEIYGVQSDGLVREYAAAGGKPVAAFSIAHAATAAVMSPDGSTLYVLKSAGPDFNVAVVNLNTEAVTRALPAPANAVALTCSADGTTLYDAVGTGAVGNVQTFRIPASR